MSKPSVIFISLASSFLHYFSNILRISSSDVSFKQQSSPSLTQDWANIRQHSALSSIPIYQTGPLYVLTSKDERGSFNKATPQIPARAFPWLPAAWVQAPPVCLSVEIGVKLAAKCRSHMSQHGSKAAVSFWTSTWLYQLHYSSAQLGSRPTSSSLPPSSFFSLTFFSYFSASATKMLQSWPDPQTFAPGRAYCSLFLVFTQPTKVLLLSTHSTLCPLPPPPATLRSPSCRGLSSRLMSCSSWMVTSGGRLRSQSPQGSSPVVTGHRL